MAFLVKKALPMISFDEWPRCFYERGLLCGDPRTGRLRGINTVEHDFNKSWHIADMCRCPSCPLRCAIRDALSKV